MSKTVRVADDQLVSISDSRDEPVREATVRGAQRHQNLGIQLIGRAERFKVA
eukprot:COSAG02_NODE_52475_length_307_cov_1.230769_1_plen_51_part_01